MFHAVEIEGTLDVIVFPGKYRYLVVSEPPGWAAPRRADGRPARVRGEAADLPFEGAWMPHGDGRRYLLLSADHCRRAGLAPGDPVPLRFDVVEPDEARTPPELGALLAGDEAARAAWEALTPGRRRGLAHLIDRARTDETRARRAAELAAAVRSGEPPGPPKRRR